MGSKISVEIDKVGLEVKARMMEKLEAYLEARLEAGSDEGQEANFEAGL